MMGNYPSASHLFWIKDNNRFFLPRSPQKTCSQSTPRSFFFSVPWRNFFSCGEGPACLGLNKKPEKRERQKKVFVFLFFFLSCLFALRVGAGECPCQARARFTESTLAHVLEIER